MRAMAGMDQAPRMSSMETLALRGSRAGSLLRRALSSIPGFGSERFPEHHPHTPDGPVQEASLKGSFRG